MNPVELTSRLIRLDQIGVFTKERVLKKRYRPLKVFESVKVKLQLLQNLIRSKGKFNKFTEYLTKQ